MQQSRELTLVQVFLPERSLLTDSLIVLVGSAVVALFAQVTIQIQPVPITGSTLGVLLVGAVLGSRCGGLAVLTYLAEGLLGLPVFQNGNSAWTPGPTGEPYILGSTLGYLVGFAAGAFVVGWLIERFRLDHVPWATVLALLAGNVAIWVPGLLWLAAWLPAHGITTGALQVGLLPFLLGDALKILAAAVTLPSAWDLVQRFRGRDAYPSGDGDAR